MKRKPRAHRAGIGSPDDSSGSSLFVLMTDAKALLPLGEVTSRLQILGQHHVGLRTIPIASIIGSVDRAVDFDRFFRTSRRELRRRLDTLRTAFEGREMPPISVYEAGGFHFVIDGHHRVSLGRQDGGEFIDADVISIQTSEKLHPGVDFLELVHTEQHRIFKERTGLMVHNPDAKILVSRPIGYAEHLQAVEAHAYERSSTRGELVPMPEATADWYATSWQPALEAINASGLARRFDFKTEGDLYLWTHAKLRELRAVNPKASWADAAAARVREPVTRAHRRDMLAQRRTPLPTK